MVATVDFQANTDGLVEKDSWCAVLERDARFDGKFVYAVRSTRVYCKPSCPSRRPDRKQVAFFSMPEAAEQAGFRPCRRCRPQLHPSHDPQIEMVRRVCQHIRNNSRDNSESFPTLPRLSAGVGVSPYHLQRTFKRLMGITPRQYADACRLGTLKVNLKNGRSVTDALYEAGYGSSSRLYEHSSAQLGMTPAAYRRGGPSLHIAYTFADSALGLLLVAATQQGVCSVSLGDDEMALEEALRREYMASEVRREDTVLKEWVEAILHHLSGRLPHLDLPLDIRATAFERLVWEQLKRIPYGETRSYGEIGAALGRPKAARAVARACGANPVALLIPCHRAIRKDGSAGGYRWGAARKEALLARERTLAVV